MALIKCPECSNEVSDKAASCPKCGHPLQAATPQPTTDLDALIKQTLSRYGKIAAIQVYRTHNPGAGLADAKNYVEDLAVGLPLGTLANPSQQTNAVAMFFLVSFLLLAGLGGIYWWVTSQPSSPPAATSQPSVGVPAPPPPQPAPEQPVARLSADVLYRAYDANEVSADATYKGKIVMITGKIRDIGKDIMDTPYIVVGGQGFLDGVQCMFPKSVNSPLASLYKGESVTAQGRVAGKLGNVLLRECQLE